MTTQTQKITKSYRPFVLMGLVLVLGTLWICCYQLLSFQEIKSICSHALHFSTQYPMAIFGILAVTQVVAMALSLPTKAALTVLAGALLGPFIGSIATIVGVAIGTSILFFATDKFFSGSEIKRFENLLTKIKTKLHKRPTLAIAGLRLMVTLPYGPITIAAALAKVPYQKFLVGSLVGDLPVILLYAFAGERLFSLANTSDAISWTTILILVAAGSVFFFGALFAQGNGKQKEKTEIQPTS